jgi:hypothetical protein
MQYKPGISLDIVDGWSWMFDGGRFTGDAK